jgi:hypothetical protein
MGHLFERKSERFGGRFWPRKMYQFVIDMGEESSYSLAAPKGVMSRERSLKIEQLAASNWQIAKGLKPIMGRKWGGMT